MGRKVKGKTHFDFRSKSVIEREKIEVKDFQTRIEKGEMGFGLKNEINANHYLSNENKQKLKRLADVKERELERLITPEQKMARSKEISDVIRKAEQRKKKQKELDDKIRSEFLQLINNADTKNKLSRLRNKIDRDPKINFKIKFELQEIIRKKKRKLKK